MKVLVTGSAGFIGSALSIRLLNRGDEVVGIDNHNDYYDVELKESRLNRHIEHPNYKHIRMDIEDKSMIESLFKENQFEGVVNLAAQAGVRYSIDEPRTYLSSNIVGTHNIIELAHKIKVKHLMIASSSSVYGANKKIPYSENDSVKLQMSIYASTKLATESIAHSYSHIWKIPTTVLRFFTVYGPWGRPDMALFKFTKSILEGKKIDIYNKGNLYRDFTYIEDRKSVV